MKKPIPPKVLSGKEIYDMLMWKIEPELTTEQLPTLRKKYSKETEERKRSRITRYRVAMDEYDRAFEEYSKELNESVHSYKKEANTYLEELSNNREVELLANIKEHFSQT